ncbi:hypothetical protein H0H93_007194 [Arthromyces matolae]|nr:hypothetical protein H0H93_007194 [Arthromyces matolae]
MSVSLEPELDLNQKRISLKTEKRRNTRQNTSSTQAPAFDGVVISTPTKQKLLKNAPLPQPPSRDPSCIPQSVDPRLVLDSVLTESPAPEFRHLSVPQTPTSLPIIPNALPIHFHSYLDAQKKAILQALQQPPEVISENKEDEMLSTNRVSAEQLTGLLSGTIHRGEGNSCLVLGPRGSGKSRASPFLQLVQQCIDDFSTSNPIVLRLSGWTQHSDRLAMREIAYQLRQQVDTLVLPQGADALNADEAEEDDEARLIPDNIISTKLPPAAQLPALISLLPTLDRPTIVIVDGFDLYTLHPRQALLYCLFDTVQSCQALPGTKGIAVIGVTSRIDTLVLLEKRVKSRFSGRMIRTAPPHTVEGWEVLARAILTPRIEEFLTGESAGTDLIVEWYGLWTAIVEQFMQDRAVQNLWNEAFSVTRDVRMLTRALRVGLPYPAVCLLIASVHADTAGQSTFTFEMLHECFRDQVRASTSAPVQVKGGSIGMVRCSRQVLMGTFEDLVAMRVFVPVAAYAQSTAKEFVKYRSVIEREDVKKAVEKIGQVNLKKWLTKATQ